MAKRSRGWAHPSLKEVSHFLLDINSIECSGSSSTAVEFEYNVSDKVGALFHNGKLNLRASEDWSVAMSNFSMPNNFETFPSIDAESNLSSAFLNMHIYAHYTVDEEDLGTVIKFPIRHFPHLKYTPEEVLATLRESIDKGFLTIGKSGAEGLISKSFWSTVADFYIAPDSGFVHLKAISAKKPDPLQTHAFNKVFFDNLKEGVLPYKKTEIGTFLLVSTFIWTGTPVIDYLGKFDFSILWEAGKTSGTTFHGDVLDKLVFSYSFASASLDRPYLISSKPCNLTRQSAVHVKTDLIATSHPNDFGNLAICTIPQKEEHNISFTPPKLIWRPIRGNNIEKIRFRLTDERGTLLNYNEGYTALTLLFKPTELITF
jgi:hypothetical protein